jgi:pilus assembly protein Flp/PilA
MSKLFVEFKSRLEALREDKGATAVEYVLIVGGIAAVLVAAIALFGTEITTRIGNIFP